jgi:hypothetical protein
MDAKGPRADDADWVAARTTQVDALGAGLDDVERTLLAQLYFASNGHREGLALARSRAGSSDALALIEARARFALGETAAALALVDERLARRPGDLLGLYYRAQFLAQSGRLAEGVRVLGALIDRMPDFPGALETFAPLALPGPSYRDILRRVHDVLRPRTYLEIGVEHGTTLAYAVHSEHVIGIDPAPPPPGRVLPARARYFQMTSDAFFAAHRRSDVLPAAVDLAFVDGKHWFDYALRDFCSVEAWCAPGSTVVLHDCLPVAKAAASRQRQTRFWVGDTWKALECLLGERPDLEVSVVPCHPSGLVFVRRLDPASRVLTSKLDELIARYLPLDYPYPVGTLPASYPIVPNTEPQLRRLFDSWRAGEADAATEAK